MGNEKELHQVATIIMGLSPKGDTYNNDGEGTPLLNGPTEFGEINPTAQKWTTDPKRLSKKNDILFCVRGSTGRMNWSDREYCIGRGLCAIRSKTEDLIDTCYIFYSLKYNLSKLLSVQTGSVFPNLSKKDIFNFKIYWPDSTIRKSITTHLKQLDDKIELNRQMNRTLEAMARAIFKSWFVDFDPVYAKMEGRDYPLPAEVLDLFPDELVESELGLIPKGWEVKPLPELIDFKEGPGIRNWNYTNSDEGVRFINIRCIQPNHDIDITTMNRIFERVVKEKYSHFYLEENDIIVSTSGTLGKYAIVRTEHLPMLLNTSVIRFRPIEQLISLPFLWGYIDSPVFKNDLELRASGSVQKNFGPMHLKRMKVVLPSHEIIEAFDKTIQPVFERFLHNLTESSILARIRDLLLRKLMSGEIEI